MMIQDKIHNLAPRRLYTAQQIMAALLFLVAAVPCCGQITEVLKCQSTEILQPVKTHRRLLIRGTNKWNLPWG